MAPSQLTLVHQGSSTDICRDASRPNELVFMFSDGWSAFDVGRCPQPIPGKAAAMRSAAVRSFAIANALGVPTHFIAPHGDDGIRVREATIVTSGLTHDSQDYFIPLEWIVRFHVAGSLFRDLASGKKRAMPLGFRTNDVPPEGTVLSWPMIHITTKLEDVDRDLSHVEARKLAGLDPSDEVHIWGMLLYLSGAINSAFKRAGFARFDGKFECAMMDGRVPTVVDRFGTPDEDRPVLLSALHDGKVEHYGKEYLRQYLIKIGFKKAVDNARASGAPDPLYPMIPEDILREAGRRYAAFAEAYDRVVI